MYSIRGRSRTRKSNNTTTTTTNSVNRGSGRTIKTKRTPIPPIPALFTIEEMEYHKLAKDNGVIITNKEDLKCFKKVVENLKKENPDKKINILLKMTKNTAKAFSIKNECCTPLELEVALAVSRFASNKNLDNFYEDIKKTEDAIFVRETVDNKTKKKTHRRKKVKTKKPRGLEYETSSKGSIRSGASNTLRSSQGLYYDDKKKRKKIKRAVSLTPPSKSTMRY